MIYKSKEGYIEIPLDKASGNTLFMLLYSIWNSEVPKISYKILKNCKHLEVNHYTYKEKKEFYIYLMNKISDTSIEISTKQMKQMRKIYFFNHKYKIF
jgi:hypothetical protein